MAISLGRLSAVGRTLVHYHLEAKITRIEPEGDHIRLFYEISHEHPVKEGSLLLNQEGAVHFEPGQSIAITVSRE